MDLNKLKQETTERLAQVVEDLQNIDARKPAEGWEPGQEEAATWELMGRKTELLHLLRQLP